MATLPQSGILVEAESFDDFGGWVLDSQFELEMGSPYLLAHGNGKPVLDATSMVHIPDAGGYNVWVRTKDWVPGHHPGKFKVAVKGTVLDTEFGANDKDWNWEFGGRVHLQAGDAQVVMPYSSVEKILLPQTQRTESHKHGGENFADCLTNPLMWARSMLWWLAVVYLAPQQR